jgi:hypothetical protein
MPQSAFIDAQVTGTHGGTPHTLGVPPPPQVAGGVQEPQDRRPPQPSAAGPQSMPSCLHVFGMHIIAMSTPLPLDPHWLGTPPPPQVSGAWHVPQSIMLPQPSPAGPQLKPSCAHVWGTQPEFPPH